MASTTDRGFRGFFVGKAGVLGAFLTLSALAAPARAASDAEQAEALIREGVQLRAQDKAARALPLFEKAYQVSRSPRTAAQLGLCELELGYFVTAERYLNEALASPDHPWISKNKTTLKRQLDSARAGIGELALIVSPGNADVLLNHKPVDRSTLGAPLRLDKGPVDVEVRAPGYEPAVETITIFGGRRVDRTFALLPEAAKPAPALALGPGSVPPPGSGPAPGTDPGAAATLTASPTPPVGGSGEPSSGIRIAAWVTTGVAVGALAFGTVEAINSVHKRDDFNNHMGLVGGATIQDCATANLSAACKPLKDAYDRAVMLSIVGFATAGALAVTSTVLFVLSSHSGGGFAERGASPWALTCVPDPGLRGAGCSLRF